MARSAAQLIDLSTGETFEVSEGVSVGRQLGDRVFPRYRSLSRAHFSIRFEGESWFIEDLGSANGTYLNGRRLPPNRRTPIRSGDRIIAGKAKFGFEIPSPLSASSGEELTRIAVSPRESSSAVEGKSAPDEAASIALEPIPSSPPPSAAPVFEEGTDVGRLFVDFFEFRGWRGVTRILGALFLVASIAAVRSDWSGNSAGLPHTAIELSVREFLTFLLAMTVALFAHYVAARTIAEELWKSLVAAALTVPVFWVFGVLVQPITHSDLYSLENRLHRECLVESSRDGARCLSLLPAVKKSGLSVSAAELSKLKAFLRPGEEKPEAKRKTRGPSPAGNPTDSANVRNGSAEPAGTAGPTDLASADLNYRTKKYLEALKEAQDETAAFVEKTKDPEFCRMNWECFEREAKREPIRFASDVASITGAAIEWATRQKSSISQCDAECSEKLTYQLYSMLLSISESILVPNLFAYQDYTATSVGAQYVQLQEDAMLIRHFEGLRDQFQKRVASKSHVRNDLDFVKLARRYEDLTDFPRTHGLLVGRLSPAEVEAVFRNLPTENPFRGITEIRETLRAYQSSHTNPL